MGIIAFLVGKLNRKKQARKQDKSMNAVLPYPPGPIPYLVPELSQELIDMIFHNALVSPSVILNPGIQPNILLAFPANWEIQRIYYLRNTFKIEISNCDVTPHVGFLWRWTAVWRMERKLQKMRKLARQDWTPRNVLIEVFSGPGNRSWANLMVWLHYVYLRRSIDPGKLLAVHPEEHAVTAIFTLVKQQRKAGKPWAKIEGDLLPQLRIVMGAIHGDWLL